MILVIGLAAMAAAAVLLYSHWRDAQPELAEASTRRAEQLAAVVLVMARAVAGIAEAMAYGRPRSIPSARGPYGDWDTDEDDYR